MSKGVKITLAVILIAAALLGIYDIFAAWYWGMDAGATISWVTYSLSCKYPVVPFVVGFLCGHIFAGMKGIT